MRAVSYRIFFIGSFTLWGRAVLSIAVMSHRCFVRALFCQSLFCRALFCEGAILSVAILSSAILFRSPLSFNLGHNLFRSVMSGLFNDDGRYKLTIFIYIKSGIHVLVETVGGKRGRLCWCNAQSAFLLVVGLLQ